MAKMVTIYVPHDPEGPTAGGGGLWDVLFVVLRAYDWVFHPIRTWKGVQYGNAVQAKSIENNIREGKNPDGSYSRDFPGATTLRDALLELGLDVLSVEARWEKAVVIDCGSVPLVNLTEAQIQKAIIECQVAGW